MMFPADVASVEPTFTFGSIGIMLTIIVSVGGGIGAAIWFIIRSTTSIHAAFSGLSTDLKLVQASIKQQETRLEHIEDEMKLQTTILQDQKIQGIRIENLESRMDKWEDRVQRLIEELGYRRLGSSTPHPD